VDIEVEFASTPNFDRYIDLKFNSIWKTCFRLLLICSPSHPFALKLLPILKKKPFVPRDWQLFVHNMIQACEKVQRYTKGMNQQAFFENELIQDAVLRNLTIISEAASKVPDDIQQQFDGIEGRKIIAFHNTAMHEYFGLDRDIVWDVVSRKAPELATQL